MRGIIITSSIVFMCLLILNYSRFLGYKGVLVDWRWDFLLTIAIPLFAVGFCLSNIQRFFWLYTLTTRQITADFTALGISKVLGPRMWRFLFISNLTAYVDALSQELLVEQKNREAKLSEVQRTELSLARQHLQETFELFPQDCPQYKRAIKILKSGMTLAEKTNAMAELYGQYQTYLTDKEMSQAAVMKAPKRSRFERLEERFLEEAEDQPEGSSRQLYIKAAKSKDEKGVIAAISALRQEKKARARLAERALALAGKARK